MRIHFLLIAALISTSVTALAEDCKPLGRYATIPFKDDGTGRISLPATLAGKATRLTLDTGAYWSSIREDLAKALNLKIRTSYDLNLRDASGKVMKEVAVVPEAKLGPLNFGAAEFFLSGTTDDDLPMEHDGGLFGQNLMTQIDLEIDSAAQTVSFFSQDHCAGHGVHWADEAVVLPYQRAKARGRGNSRLRQGPDKNQIDPPIVTAELNGAPISVLFDTGATFSVLNAAVAKRRFNIDASSPGAKPAGTVYVAGGDAVETFQYTFPVLTISGIRFDNVTVLIGEFGDTSEMILGMHEMKKLHLFFAFKEGVIYATAADAGRRPAQK
jgi:predicted aspartyl protease